MFTRGIPTRLKVHLLVAIVGGELGRTHPSTVHALWPHIVRNFFSQESCNISALGKLRTFSNSFIVQRNISFYHVLFEVFLASFRSFVSHFR